MVNLFVSRRKTKVNPPPSPPVQYDDLDDGLDAEWLNRVWGTQTLGPPVDPDILSRVRTKTAEASIIRESERDFLDFMIYITPLEFHEDIETLLTHMNFNPSSDKPKTQDAVQSLYTLLEDIFRSNLAKITNPTEENLRGLGMLLDVDGREIPLDPRHHYSHYIGSVFKERANAAYYYEKLRNVPFKHNPRLEENRRLATYTPHSPSKIRYEEGTKKKDSIGYVKGKQPEHGRFRRAWRRAEQSRRKRKTRRSASARGKTRRSTRRKSR